MRILSWNVNGIRSAARQGFLEWLSFESPDVVCVQEAKAQVGDLDETLLNPFGYTTTFHSAQKKGYSGVGFFTKVPPLSLSKGLGAPQFDSEGRVITAEFKDFYLINAYFPNSQRDHARLPYKLEFCNALQKHIATLRKKSGKHVVLTGDLNIAHREIDLKNPASNRNNAGFLPEERKWMDHFLEAGHIDTFRHFTPESGHYTWWSYRPGVREKNIGWRLDYFLVDAPFISAVKQSIIQPEVKGSDHCPVGLTLDL